MEKYEQKLVIMLAIAAVLLACYTVVFYTIMGRMTLLGWVCFDATILILLIIVAIIRKESIAKAEEWYKRAFPILFIILLLIFRHLYRKTINLCNTLFLLPSS